MITVGELKKKLGVETLIGADLSRAILIGADLIGANMSGADLSGADLIGADLRWCVGDGRRVKTFVGLQWRVTYTNEIICIGCKSHKISDWMRFTDEDIKNMGLEALEFWKKYKDFILNMIEGSPAE